MRTSGVISPSDGRPRLASVTIVQNEAARLHDCLASLRGLVDEMIVVDGYSVDATLVTAAAFTRRIFLRHFDCAAHQMNFGVAQARADWVLIVDADERVPAALAEEIRGVLAAPPRHAAFMMPRANRVLGRWLRHGGNFPDYNAPRLFRRGQARFEPQPVHARLHVNGKCGRLATPLLHLSYPDMESYFAKFNRYTTWEAERMAAAGERFRWRRLATVTCGHAAQRLFRQRADRDGAAGWIYLGLGGLYDVVRYLKLREREFGHEG
ncbi:MAG: glycosyltransferase family 2 protein [Terriglobales bacterium]